MTRPLKVNAYMAAIPPGNKNPEKPKLIEYFVEGVQKNGDKGQIITSFAYEPADVGVGSSAMSLHRYSTQGRRTGTALGPNTMAPFVSHPCRSCSAQARHTTSTSTCHQPT